MSLSLRQLVQLSRDLQGKSDATVDRALQDRDLSPEERISVKHAISAAAAQQRSLDARLATDDAEYSITRDPVNETQRLLVRSGFKLGRPYRETEIDQLLEASGFDATQRIACRLELRELGMRAAAVHAPRQIFSMRAAAERPAGKMLLNPDGTPRTLRCS